ncbi:MAG TPA: archease [Jiangellaceae bacterium]|nr:archease [Jiangellaceae bacterium]
MTGRGHRIVPHTADVGVEAWGPNRESCIAEAVLGVVEAFAETASVHPERDRRSWFANSCDEDLLVNVLDDAIYYLDTEHEVPVDIEVEPRGDGVAVRFAMADASRVRIVGAAPKGVSLHGLRIGPLGGSWSCSLIVDV